jgi:acylphosphatase
MTTGDPAGNVRLEAVIRGRVQGVGYRMYAGRAAAARGVVGWVANAADGSVQCVAEGPRVELEAFARDLAVGPPGSTVDRLDSTWSPATGTFDRFALRSGWHGGD